MRKVALLVVLLAFGVSAAWAGDKDEKKTLTNAVGTVAAVKEKVKDGDKEKVTGSTVTVNGKAYTIDDADGKDKDLAKLDGRTVEICGTLTDKKGQEVLKVEKVAEVVTGKLDKVMDKKGEKIQHLKVVNGDRTVYVYRDDRTKALEKVAGEEVDLTGDVKENGKKESWITVKDINYTLTGAVAVTKKDDRVTGATLKVGDKKYTIKQDEIGKALTEKMADKQVKVRGTLSKDTLMVKSYELVP